MVFIAHTTNNVSYRDLLRGFEMQCLSVRRKTCELLFYELINGEIDDSELLSTVSLRVFRNETQSLFSYCPITFKCTGTMSAAPRASRLTNSVVVENKALDLFGVPRKEFKVFTANAVSKTNQ